MPHGVVFYQNVTRGIANPDGSQPVQYFGKVFRIPRSEHDTIRQLEWEINPHELLEGVTDRDGRALMPLASSVIERLETYDRETGDVLVMYRVPCAAVEQDL